MPAENIALILSIASFVGVIIGPVATSFIAARQASADRKDAQRDKYNAYLAGLMNALIEVRSQLEFRAPYTGGHWDDQLVKEREEAFGKAYAISLSVNDGEIKLLVAGLRRAEHRSSADRLAALDEIIKRLGKMIDQLIRPV